MSFIHISYCVCVKRRSLYKYLLNLSSSSSSSSIFVDFFSARPIQHFGIVYRYFWFWKPFHMVQGGVEFSFLEGIDVGIDIRIYIFISIRPMTAKFDKHLDIELTQVRLIKHVLTTPHVKITWQTKNISSLLDCLSPPKSWHDDKLPWWAPDHKVTWFFDHMVLQDKVKPLYLHSVGAPSLEGRQLTLGGSYQ